MSDFLDYPLRTQIEVDLLLHSFCKPCLYNIALRERLPLQLIAQRYEQTERLNHEVERLHPHSNRFGSSVHKRVCVVAINCDWRTNRQF
jgi:hypothetical protein